MTITIGVDEVVAALQTVVADKGPEHANPETDHGSCVYVQAGEPSCIVGNALALLDVTLPDEDWWANEQAIGVMAFELPVEFEPAALRVLIEVQAFADLVVEPGAHKSWGEALSSGLAAAQRYVEVELP